MTQHVDQELTVGAQTVQPGAYQRIGQHKRGLPAGGTVGDDLGQHWVVVDRHCGTVDDPGIQPDAGPLSQRVELRPNPGTSIVCITPACGCQPCAGSSA